MGGFAKRPGAPMGQFGGGGGLGGMAQRSMPTRPQAMSQALMGTPSPGMGLGNPMGASYGMAPPSGAPMPSLGSAMGGGLPPGMNGWNTAFGPPPSPSGMQGALTSLQNAPASPDMAQAAAMQQTMQGMQPVQPQQQAAMQPRATIAQRTPLA